MNIFLASDREDIRLIQKDIISRLGVGAHVATKFPTGAAQSDTQADMIREQASSILREWQAIRRADAVLAIAPGGSMELGFALGYGIFTASIGGYPAVLSGLVDFPCDSIEEFCDWIREFK